MKDSIISFHRCYSCGNKLMHSEYMKNGCYCNESKCLQKRREAIQKEIKDDSYEIEQLIKDSMEFRVRSI